MQGILDYGAHELGEVCNYYDSDGEGLQNHSMNLQAKQLFLAKMTECSFLS